MQAEVSMSSTAALAGMPSFALHIASVGKFAVYKMSPLTLATRQAEAIRRVVKA